MWLLFRPESQQLSFPSPYVGLAQAYLIVEHTCSMKEMEHVYGSSDTSDQL